MIFTIGHTESYTRGLSDLGDDFKKLGATNNLRGAPYLGGSVWGDVSDAKKYLSDNMPRLMQYSVFGVLASWDRDTVHIEAEPFRRLLKTSKIVEIEK